MPNCLIALGANLGDRQESLQRAIEKLDEHPRVAVTARSSFHATAPIGGPRGQGEFLNAAVRVETSLEPHELLKALLRIESDLGRQREARWGARAIDLDILLYADQIVASPDLEIPHPRMAFRRFVLEPAVEIASEMMHPVSGWAIGELLDHLNRAANYVAISGPPGANRSEIARSVVEALERDHGFDVQLVEDPAEVSALASLTVDATGPDWDREIEFLRCRAELLSAERLAEASGWKISDFCLTQVLAQASLWRDMPGFAALLEAVRDARAGAMAAKLVVVLEVDDAALFDSIRRVSDGLEGLSREKVNRLNAAIKEMTRNGDFGPVQLVLDANRPQQAVEEVVAAILSMQP